jgi:UDP:flavonoid glycosyltransferase YjiC (YdhE family)
MESLAAGVPVVALPLANDQPGVAERVRFHGVGRVTSAGALRAGRLGPLVEAALGDAAMAARARAMAEAIRAAGGAERAAALVEQALAGAAPARPQ